MLDRESVGSMGPKNMLSERPAPTYGGWCRKNQVNVAGTPLYLPPEIAKLKKKNLDPDKKTSLLTRLKYALLLQSVKEN